MKLRHCLPFACAAAVVLAHAAETPADATARTAVHHLVPQATIETVEASPLPGYRQAIIGSQMVYVSDDGKYLLHGTLYDTQSKRDLSAMRLAVDHKTKVDAVPKSKRIVFAPQNPKYKVTVFTDLDCGYCRKLHAQIAEYNAKGIEVDYLFFPRSGLNSPSYDKAVSVWCAKDRNTAFTAAKAGKTPTPAKCENPVAEEYKLGAQVGVDGTPTIFAPDGTKIGGYLTPSEMVAKLENLGKADFAGN
ncbi:MAG TPA: thioredoxin fold domain-containing protein [Rhodanobacteraceae bacterium]|jgi:thiol:disulfide interchange protein DsbC